MKYMLKINNNNTRKSSEICSKLKIKALDERYWRRSGVLILNFERISHLLLRVFIVDFEQVNGCWETL